MVGRGARYWRWSGEEVPPMIVEEMSNDANAVPLRRRYKSGLLL